MVELYIISICSEDLKKIFYILKVSYYMQFEYVYYLSIYYDFNEPNLFQNYYQFSNFNCNKCLSFEKKIEQLFFFFDNFVINV